MPRILLGTQNAVCRNRIPLNHSDILSASFLVTTLLPVIEISLYYFGREMGFFSSVLHSWRHRTLTLCSAFPPWARAPASYSFQLYCFVGRRDTGKIPLTHSNMSKFLFLFFSSNRVLELLCKIWTFTKVFLSMDKSAFYTASGPQPKRAESGLQAPACSTADT